MHGLSITAVLSITTDAAVLLELRGPLRGGPRGELARRRGRRVARRRRGALVERFDIEPFSDFSAK